MQKVTAVTPLFIPFAGAEGNSTVFPSLIQTGDELILVDAGYPGQADAIFKAAAQQGIDLRALTKIVVTHHDFDHVGSLKELTERCLEAVVLASETEAPFINGKQKPFRLQQAEVIYPTLPEGEKEKAKGFEAFLKSIAPCEVAQTVKEGDAIDTGSAVVVIETPGHTVGHISLYLPETNTLIAGDAVVLAEGRLVLANPDYAFDLAQATASAERIRDMAPATIICYHGGVCHKPDDWRFSI